MSNFIHSMKPVTKYSCYPEISKSLLMKITFIVVMTSEIRHQSPCQTRHGGCPQDIVLTFVNTYYPLTLN